MTYEINDEEFEKIEDVISYIEKEYANETIGEDWWENGKIQYQDDEDEMISWLDENGFPVGITYS